MSSGSTGSRDSEQLVRACRSGRVSAVMQCLQLGADVNAGWWGDGTGRTPLLAALESGHTEVAGFLVDRGADVNAADKRGATPMHAAAQANSVAGLRLLAGRGADPAAVDALGRSPLMRAVLAGSLATATELALHLLPGKEGGLKSLEQVTVNASKDTAFTLAARTGSVAMLSLLVRAGADTRRRDGRGRNALDVAEETGNHAAVRFMAELYSRPD